MKNNKTKQVYSKIFKKAKELIRNPEKEDEGADLLIELMVTSYREHAIFELALYYQKKENYKQAKICYESILKGNNKFKPRATFELGRIYACTGNSKKAKDLFEKVINQEDKDRTDFALYELAELYMREGNTKQAMENLKKMLYSNNPASKKYAKIKLAHLFANIGEYKMAENILVNLLKREMCDYAVRQLIFLYLKINNIEEAFKIFKMLPRGTKYYHDIKAYVYYKLGKSKETFLDSYYRKQLVAYSEQLTLEHINEHLFEYEGKSIHTLFNSDINMENLLQEVKEKIKEENPIECTLVEKYIIQCEEEIAVIDGEKVKTIEVVTIPDTKNILTMYPIKIINSPKECKKFKK